MAEKGSILIVDDEPKICQFLEVLLRREGHDAVSVYNADDALGRVEEDSYDAVITDLKMPGMDGFELVRQLKARHPKLPIIMITGYATVETAVKALRAGVEDYVTKPFNVEELRRVVNRTLQIRRIEDENRRLTELLTQSKGRRDWDETATEAALEAVGPPSSSGADGTSATGLSLGLNDEAPASVNSLNSLLKRALGLINDHLGARASSIMIRSGGSLEVRVCEGDRVRELIGTRQPIGTGVAGHVAQQKQSLLVRDKDDRSALPPGPEQTYETDSFVCVPILHCDEVLGVVSVGEKENREPFDETDLRFVEFIAGQLAPAIEHAVALHSLQAQCRVVLETLVHAVEAKDPHFGSHSQRVAGYACALARACGATAEEIDLLRHTAHLHDIGKMTLNDRLLGKEGKLSEQERDRIQQHPLIGERMVGGLEFLRPAMRLIRHHHERVDGKGYPDGLRGNEIPRLARILTIADAFDAMTSERPYREAMTSRQATEEIHAVSGLQFDGELATIFCRMVLAPDN